MTDKSLQKALSLTNMQVKKLLFLANNNGSLADAIEEVIHDLIGDGMSTGCCPQCDLEWQTENLPRFKALHADQLPIYDERSATQIFHDVTGFNIG